MSSPTVPISVSADTNAASEADLQHFHYNIAMSCGGCSGAITRIFSKYPGVVKFDVSLETQTADAWTKSDVDPLKFSQKVLLSGKTVNSATVDGANIDLTAAKSYAA